MAVPSYILCQKIIKMVSIEEAITVPAWVCAKSSADVMIVCLVFCGVTLGGGVSEYFACSPNPSPSTELPHPALL